jgi:hypothetical protein
MRARLQRALRCRCVLPAVLGLVYRNTLNDYVIWTAVSASPVSTAGCVVTGCDAGSLFAACFDAAAAPSLQGVTSTARVGEQAAGAAVKALASAPVAELPGMQTGFSKTDLSRKASLGSQTAALLQLQRLSNCALCLLVLECRVKFRMMSQPLALRWLAVMMMVQSHSCHIRLC